MLKFLSSHLLQSTISCRNPQHFPPMDYLIFELDELILKIIHPIFKQFFGANFFIRTRAKRIKRMLVLFQTKISCHYDRE
jgi:hypothetical protein